MVCVDVRDVARAHINAMTIPEAAGNRHITATENAWFAEIAKVCVVFLLHHDCTSQILLNVVISINCIFEVYLH